MVTGVAQRARSRAGRATQPGGYLHERRSWRIFETSLMDPAAVSRFAIGNRENRSEELRFIAMQCTRGELQGRGRRETACLRGRSFNGESPCIVYCSGGWLKQGKRGESHLARLHISTLEPREQENSHRRSHFLSILTVPSPTSTGSNAHVFLADKLRTTSWIIYKQGQRK